MSTTSKTKRMLTGLQPSGTLHIGNYFGSIKPFIDFMEANPDFECFLMIADQHALTSVRDGSLLRAQTMSLLRDYLALGINPEKVTIFRQSDNPDHLELGWIFNCLVTVPFLMQGHAYKDKVAKGIEPSAGLFTYPTLMAADIALYNTDIVPVGEDQRQHIEYTREAVGKFNRAYGEILKTPTERIIPDVGIVPGTDGKKMSKSYKNTIELFATESEIKSRVMSIVTDSSGDIPENVYAIHKLFKSKTELDEIYAKFAGKYKDLKEILAADIEDFMKPLREKRSAISDEDIKIILAKGNEISRTESNKTMTRVRDAIGISL